MVVKMLIFAIGLWIGYNIGAISGLSVYGKMDDEFYEDEEL